MGSDSKKGKFVKPYRKVDTENSGKPVAAEIEDFYIADLLGIRLDQLYEMDVSDVYGMIGYHKGKFLASKAGDSNS